MGGERNGPILQVLRHSPLCPHNRTVDLKSTCEEGKAFDKAKEQRKGSMIKITIQFEDKEEILPLLNGIREGAIALCDSNGNPKMEALKEFNALIALETRLVNEVNRD
jgi:hypothetical protein